MKRRGLIFNSRPNKTAVFALGLMLGLCPVSKAWADTNMKDSQVVAQAQKKVKGQVVDAIGEPLIGVNITVIGGTEGTITDIDGNYTIGVPAGAKLKFSYIGYKDQIIDVAAQTVINVKLQEDSEVLDEVVVVGYGSQRKETLTGAVTVVSDKMLKNKGTMSSPLQAMQGQVPGVTITRNSAAPGDESWGLKLRGSVSANNEEPLIVIDGVAYDGVNALRNINPSDIQSINFLKDASAAIYGSRAAGGVVLVTTKQAKEGKARIEYSGSYTYKMVGLQPELMTMNEWANAVLQTCQNDGQPDSYSWVKYAKMALANEGKYIDLDHSANPFAPSYSDVMDFVFMDTNWQDVLFGNSYSTQHDLAVSGGTEKNLYRLSVGYMYDDSNLKWGNNNNQRFNLRLTNKLKVFDNFSIESVIAYNRQDQVAPSQLNRTLTSSYPQPGLPASTIDGKPYSWGTWLSPIWFAELGGDNKLKVSEINISEKFTYNINKHLDVVANLGYNSGVASRDIKKMAITSYNYAGTKINTKADGYKQEESSYEKTSSRTDFYSMAGYVDYHNTFAQHHNVSAMVGAQYELKEYDYFGVSVKDIQNSLETVNGAGLVNLTDKHGTKWHEAVMSYYSRLNYNYKSKYLLEVNMRYDGSSKFKPENRWDFFYGISGGWRITEEAFMKNIKWLNDLKIRLSYGEVGNQSGIDRYDGTQFYKFESQSGAYIGPNKGTIIDTNGKIASLGREWERIKNYNLGLDFSLFNSRLTGTAEVYMKRNDNMLINVSYPGVLGDNAGMSNNGKFRSHGWEVMVNWSDKIGKDFTYHIGGTYSFNTNKLTDIGAVSVLKSGFVDKQQGYPLNSIFGLRYAGKAQTEEERQKYLYRFLTGNTIGLTEQNFRLGDNMYADVNNDGKLDQNDIVYLGTDDPKISFSFNVGAEWKGFDLSLVFQGAAQRTIFRTGDNNGNEIWRIPMKALYLNTSNQSVGNTWSPENRGAYYPTYSNKNEINDYNYQASSWSVEDGSYIRLKNVTLGYNVPSAFLAKTKAISSCRIYVAGADLWEYSKINDGWDPEASRKVSAAGRFPFVRTVTFGLNLTF